MVVGAYPQSRRPSPPTPAAPIFISLLLPLTAVKKKTVLKAGCVPWREGKRNEEANLSEPPAAIFAAFPEPIALT